MCENCKYRDNPIDNNYKSNPCNTCIYYDDSGYKDFRNYVLSDIPTEKDKQIAKQKIK